MTFKNEYVPPLEQEISDFMKKARITFRKGHLIDDAWTVDRENNRVLVRTGRGRDIEERDEEYWGFLNGENRYKFTTKILIRKVIEFGPPKKIALTRDILRFWDDAIYAGLPDEQTIQCIKEALQVYGAYCMASQDELCEHTLLWNGELV